MGESKASPCLLLPMCKRRKVSAIRDFPKGLKRYPDIVDIKSTNEYLKATGSENVKEIKQSSGEFEPKTKGGETCRSENAKEFKGISVQLDPKVKGDEAFGSNDVKEFEQCSEESVAKSEGDEASGSKNANEFKRTSKELDLKVKGDEAFGSKNVKDYEKCSEEVNPKSKVDESKNAKEFKGSSEELDPEVKPDEACGSKNESFKPKELPQASNDHKGLCIFDNGNVLGSEESLKRQEIGSSLKSFNLTGKMQKMLPKRRKVSANRTFPPGLVQVMPLNNIHTNTEMVEGTTNHLSAIGHVHKKLENVSEIIETDENEKDVNLLKSDVFSHSKANERNRSSSNSDKELLVDKEASTNHLELVGRSCSDIVCSSGGANMLELTYGINDIEIDGQLPDDICMAMENRELRRPSGNNSPVINDIEIDYICMDMENGELHRPSGHNSPAINDIETDGQLPDDICMAIENRELHRPSGHNSPPIDDIEIDGQLSGDICMDMENGELHCPTGHSSLAIEDIETDGKLPDDICMMSKENRELHHPSGHNSPAFNDVQETTYQLDGHDGMFLQAPNVADFFSDDCHNGFLFEDYVEPSETSRQSDWQDGSEEVLTKPHELGTLDHGIKAIAGLGDDEQILQANDITNEVSKTNKLSISGKKKEDVCSLFIPQKNPVCTNTHGSLKQRFSSVLGSVSKDKPMKHRTGQAKNVQQGVIKLERRANSVGEVKYMPMMEARKSFDKSNNFPSGKVYEKAPMSCASEKIAGRDVVQGLMAATRCPWERSKRNSTS